MQGHAVLYAPGEVAILALGIHHPPPPQVAQVHCNHRRVPHQPLHLCRVLALPPLSQKETLHGALNLALFPTAPKDAVQAAADDPTRHAPGDQLLDLISWLWKALVPRACVTRGRVVPDF